MFSINKITLIPLILALIVLFWVGSSHAQTMPSVATGQVVLVGARNVNLYGTVNPNGDKTRVWFEISTTQSSLNHSYEQDAGSGTSSLLFEEVLINRKLDTTYYYRLVARNNYGIVSGETKSFIITSEGSLLSGNGSSSGFSNNYTPTSTSNGSGQSTGASIPSVLANGPASVTTNSAVINGSVNSNNAQTNFWFEFGPTSSLGQITTAQSIGSGNSWQLVTGNLSGLEPEKTYYYRVVAQNNYGTSRGGIISFTTKSQNNQTIGGQQVLGTVSGNGNGSNNINYYNRENAGSSINQSPTTNRPSFVSLEYSLTDSGTLVLVADNVRPKPGEEFSYTIVYTNNTGTVFNEANLKILLPKGVNYISANRDPIKLSSNVIEFSLDDLEPENQGAVVIIVKINDDAQPGTNMIFTSVLGYKDSKNTQLATTSYMTILVGQVGPTFSASILDSFWGSSEILWLVAFALIVLMVMLSLRFIRLRKSLTISEALDKPPKENMLGFENMPSTFQSIDPINKVRR